MKATFRWMGSLLVALSLGTFVSLAVLLSMLWWKGALADERVLGMLAALQGIKPTTTEDAARLNPDAEQPSVDQILQARLRASLDLDLRENAIDKSLGDLRALETQLRTETNRLDGWKKSFDERLAKLQTEATNASLQEVQRTLEVIDPKQAKDQIMKMLEQPKNATDNPMHDIVTIFKAMPLDKRKKIVSQFKTEPEIEKVAEILREIRVGGPDIELFDGTRQKLKQQPGP